MSRRVKKLLLYIGVGLLVLILIAAALIGPFLYAVLNNPFNDKRFDRTAWHRARAGQGDEDPRGPMVEDLSKRHLSVGTPKADVRKLLGEPDITDSVDAREVDQYFLGHSGFMSIDGDSLTIYYDKAKRITQTRIYSH